jgi:signal transduction histidine kinase
MFEQMSNQKGKLKDPELIRKAFINMLEDMHKAREEALLSKERTRRALINMLEDLKKAKDVLEERNRELEEALRQLKETTDQLIQTEKVRALGEAMASLAHDIKNILSSLEGGMFIMNQGIQQKAMDSIVRGWEMVRRNIGRIKDLSLDMLFYAKDREPEYQLTDINSIIQEVCELLQDKAKRKKVELKWELHPSLKKVMLDPQGIYRCLLNLISNAIDAGSGLDALVEVKAEIWEDKYLRIEVSDTGCGIPEDVLKNIFVPFHSSSKGYRGTGLGLAVAHKVVSEHRGKISVSSEVGKGTTFIIEIPLQPSSTPPLSTS